MTRLDSLSLIGSALLCIVVGAQDDGFSARLPETLSLLGTDQAQIQGIEADPAANIPTRTSISVGLAPVTSWLSTSTNWALDLEGLFPTLNPSERSQLKGLWDCDQEDERYKDTPNTLQPGVTIVNGTGNVTAISTITVPASLEQYSSTVFLNQFTYTKCDGVPRVAYSGGTPSFSVYNYTSTIRDAYETTITYRVGDTTSYPIQTLPCSFSGSGSIRDNYCGYAATIFWNYFWGSSSARDRGTVYTNSPFKVPGCHFGIPVFTQRCKVGVGQATMMYWPPSSRTGDICETALPNSPGSSLALNTTEPQVVTINGTQYTSPMVYITYRDIEYISTGTATHGVTSASLPLLVLSFMPSEVSSLCVDGNNVQTLPFNFQDLEGDVPWAAFNCSLPGDADSYLPIDQYSMPYSPYLAWPNTFLDLLHSWNTYDADLCSFGINEFGIRDPPHLLTQALSLTQPKTTPGGTLTTMLPITAEPAAPSVTPDSPPVRTSPVLSQPTTDPSSQDNDPGNGANDSGPSQDPSDDSAHNGEDVGSSPPGIGPSGQSDDSNRGSPGQRIPSLGQNGASQMLPEPVGGDPFAVADQITGVNPSSESSSVPNNNILADGSRSPVGIGGFIASMLGRPISDSAPTDKGAESTNAGLEDAGSRQDAKPGTPDFAPRQGPNVQSVDPSGDSDDSRVAELSAPLRADIDIGDERVFVQHLANNANVVQGSTFWAGDVATVAGQTMSFGTSGVVVGSKTVDFTQAPSITATRAVDSGTFTPPAMVIVGGDMILYGNEAMVDGVKVTYGADGIVIGTETVGIPSNPMMITLEGGRVLKVGPATATQTATAGQMKDAQSHPEGAAQSSLADTATSNARVRATETASLTMSSPAMGNAATAS
ncbi:Hypothetical protein D9617_1g085190 [Elsinoe fawcettii]|nr:Hypothetical protein D9617_1g085190 [Elsinoe fawcettii]